MIMKLSGGGRKKVEEISNSTVDILLAEDRWGVYHSSWMQEPVWRSFRVLY